MIESGFRRTFIRFYWVFFKFFNNARFCLGCKFFLDFCKPIFFCNFFGWIFNFFLSSSWLSSLRNYTSNHVSRSFFLRFLFHCRYSKCMCSSMKWLVQLPWNIVSAKVFFFVDSNAFRRNIKQVMSMNSKNHSINNRKKWLGKVMIDHFRVFFVILFGVKWHTFSNLFQRYWIVISCFRARSKAS